MRNSILKSLMIFLIVLQTSTASSDPQKIIDVKLKSGEKAPFAGVLTHEDMYRYLRAEEQRAVDLETELIVSRNKDSSPKISLMIPLTVGIAIGALGATYLTNKEVFTTLAVGVISGGLIVWSFQ